MSLDADDIEAIKSAVKAPVALRDLFAAAALQGMLANAAQITDRSTGGKHDKTPEVCADIAYQFAESMLAQRDKIP